MSSTLRKRLLALFLSLCMPFTCCTPMLTASAAQDDQYDAMRKKFFSMAIGGEYDPTDERYAPMIKYINDTAQTYWDTMNKTPVCNAVNSSYVNGGDPSLDYLWKPYQLGDRAEGEQSGSLQFSFQYLRNMALAYQTKGCKLYQNKELLADILSAVKYICENHFYPELSSFGRFPYDGWFGWQIGAPVYLGETLMLLYDEFTPEQIKEYATAMVHFLGRNTWSGANGTWAERIHMYAGILLKDASWLDFVKNRIPELLSYTRGGDGYYVDGTFVQHTYITYNGGYGLMILTDAVFIENMLSGTSWELSKDNIERIYKFVYDTYLPTVYEGLEMDSFRGREITRTDTSQPRGGILIANALMMLAENAPADIATDFKGIVKQWFDNDYMMNELFHSADTPWFKFPMDTAVKVLNVLEDDSIEPYDMSNRNYQMGSGARAVHFTDDYAFSVSMMSKRIAAYETGDSNRKGWYTGNGMTQLFQSGDMGRYEGVNKATIDWYRLPGTTAVYGQTQRELLRNNNSFVGGVTDGVFGVSGMDMAVSDNNLKAKKSWFMFDDEIVAIGSGISGNGSVETTLENLMLNEDNRTFSIDGKERDITLNGTTGLYKKISTLHMNGNGEGGDIGVYFPFAADLSIKSESRTGKWTDVGSYNTDDSVKTADYLTAWFAHGTNPTNGSYSYVLLPGKSEQETESYASGSDIEILRQDNNIHAVYEKTTGTLGACFWTNNAPALAFGGSNSYLSADHAAAVMVTESEDGIDIFVSDPTQENMGNIIIELDRSVMGAKSLDEGVELLQTYPTTKIKFSMVGTVGSTLKASLSFDTVTPPETVDPLAAINLALGKTALVSSVDPPYATVQTPDKAIDGDLDTRWGSARTTDEWYTVDLGSICTVEEIRILWQGAAGKEYKVQISDDNSNWTDMVHETANTGGGWKEYVLPQSYTGRYVRMLGITRTMPQYGYSIYEFEILGIEGVGAAAPITEIKLPASLNMVQGERQTLTATVTPASSLAIGWKSSNDKLLAINAAGLAVALANEGEVTVTAYALDDESVKAECKVTLQPNSNLPVRVSGIAIDDAPKGNLTPGKTYELKAVVTPTDATYTNVRWSSSDESVLLVNANGVVTALARGEATVTAQSVTSDKSATVKLTVGAVSEPPSEIETAAKEVENLIAALDEITDADEFEVAVEDARAAYDDLDAEAKKLVSADAIKALEDAEASLGGDKVVKGDLTDDGKVTVSDILALKTIIMSGKTPTADQVEVADTNGDGRLTVSDILGIKAIIMG